jgi:hypothetical protein
MTNLTECSECGHEHFDLRTLRYEACPLTNEGCACPMID